MHCTGLSASAELLVKLKEGKINPEIGELLRLELVSFIFKKGSCFRLVERKCDGWSLNQKLYDDGGWWKKTEGSSKNNLMGPCQGRYGFFGPVPKG